MAVQASKPAAVPAKVTTKKVHKERAPERLFAYRDTRLVLDLLWQLTYEGARPRIKVPIGALLDRVEQCHMESLSWPCGNDVLADDALLTALECVCLCIEDLVEEKLLVISDSTTGKHEFDAEGRPFIVGSLTLTQTTNERLRLDAAG